MTDKELYKKLSDPFEAADVEWRVQQSGMSNGKGWVRVLAYITSRAVQQRLDDVFGVTGWKNEFKETVDGKGYLCGISFKDENGEWITKWDGAEYTNIEPLKGALSGASKRAAVQLGIGRYLYHLETEFAICRPVESRWKVTEGANYISIKEGKNSQSRFDYEWIPPRLPEWALPSMEINNLKEEICNAKDIIQLKRAFSEAYKYANSFNRGDLVDEITKLKDERKIELQAKYKEENNASENKVRAWLEQTMTREIRGAANDSVLKIATKRLTKELIKMCEKESVDPNPFLEVLSETSAYKLNELTRRVK